VGESYPELIVKDLGVLFGARALVQWEEAPTEFGKSGLLRPEVGKKMYYTGVVLKVGTRLTDEINVGDRLFFGQFSGFKKYHDPELGRVAIVEEEAIEAVIPPRNEANVVDGGNYAYS